MMMHPDLMLNMINEHHREMIAEAEKENVLAGARTARRHRRARKSTAVRGQPAGSLAPCEPSAVVPAR